MISFFRKIRQKLLSQNRITRYLIYALGEIALVMIGILLALGVNNWNQDRMSRAREKIILQGLYQEFMAANVELKADLISRERYLRVSSALQHNHLTGEPLNLPTDSIKPFILGLISTRFYSTGHPILDDLSSSGGLELIQSDSVKLLLGEYIEEKNRYNAVEEREAKFTYEQLYPFLSNIINLSYVNNDMMMPDELNNSLASMQSDNQYGSLIYFRMQRVSSARAYGIRVEEAIGRVLSQIESELENK